MNHLIGSAIRIESEVDIVSGTTVTLDKLIDPDGTTILSAQAMSFDTVNTSVAFMIWQSTLNTHTIGRYTFITKTVNDSKENKAKGFFNLEAE